MDAGSADGLPPVGEYGFDRTCELLCGPNLTVQGFWTAKEVGDRAFPRRP
jgi:hypothetical protein